MDEEKNNVEKALNDIFEDDFIEINFDEVKNKEIEKKQDLDKSIMSANNINNYEENKKEIADFNAYVSDITDEVKEELVISEDENNELKNRNDVTIKTKEVKKNNKIFNKKLFLYFGIGIILGIILIIVILYFLINKETTVNCSYTAEDNGYKISDKYKISKKNNEILYVEGNYEYKATNEEFKKQIEYIKEEKVTVVINSYGMPGFTYIYELEDDYFKIDSYLDFLKFKHKQIEKIDQKIKPISFFEIKKDMTYKSLRKNLEKQGYKCVNK